MAGRLKQWRDGPVGITVALVGSVLALAASIGALVYDHLALQTQKQELAEAVREFELAGDRLQVDAVVQTYSQAKSAWDSTDRSGSLLTFDVFAEQDVYLKLVVTNIGRSPGAFDSAGVMVGDGKYAPSDRVLCSSLDGDNEMDPCPFPMRVDPQARQTVYVRLDSYQEQMTCNAYVDQDGVVAAVRQVSGRTVADSTGARVPFANDCPDESVPEPSD